MEDKEIKRLLGNIKVPEPGKEARERAVESAMAEFRARKEKKFKGFSWISRPSSKKEKGGLSMTTPIRITAGLAVSFVALMITVSALLLFNQTGYKSVKPIPGEKPVPVKIAESGDSAQKKTEIETLAGSIAATDSAQNKITRAGSSAAPEAERMELSKRRVEEKVAAQASAPPRDMLIATQKPEFDKKSRVPQQIALYAKKAAVSGILQEADMTGRRIWQNQEYVGRDKFEEITANPVKLVSEEPVSTFSIDVDTASYSFVRRAINNGYLPRKDSVRIEEMINYFDYDYPLPRDKTKPFRPTVAVFPTPWNPGTKLLHIGIKGFDIEPEVKPRSNLVFLIDVSGSMNSPDKLPLLKNSLRMLVDSLEPEDTVAMVVYAGAAGTVLEKTKVEDQGKILAAIDRLQAGGATAGGEGIRLAYSIAEADMDPEALNRVILATDGDFNVGIRDPEVLKDFVERKRNKNIYLSVLGFGQGNYNDELMQKLAQNGNGNAAYIDTLNEARKVLVDEVKGTLFTIAKDVKIQVEFNPLKVAEYRLIGYETRMLNREDFNNDKVDAGDIGSGHSVTALYEITPAGSKARLIDDLRYGSNKESIEDPDRNKNSEYAFLKIRYKLPNENTSKLINRVIDGKDEYSIISGSPMYSRFAAAVAAFGQLLRGDSHMGQYSYDDVITLARGAKGEDFFGYRTEFINLVRLAETAADMGER